MRVFTVISDDGLDPSLHLLLLKHWKKPGRVRFEKTSGIDFSPVHSIVHSPHFTFPEVFAKINSAQFPW